MQRKAKRGLDGGWNTYGYVSGNPLTTYDFFGLAGNGGVGNSSGVGTNTPYKHCKIDPKDPNYIICKDPNGKKIRKKKPKDWPEDKKKVINCEPDPNDWSWKNDPGNPDSWPANPPFSNPGQPLPIFSPAIPIW